MYLRLFYSIVLLLFFNFHSFSQDTGAFQNVISIEETDFNVNRTLYYYVPEEYNPSNSYRLIVGFRGGPHTNAGQFRDQLSPLADSLQAIIICPENSAEFNNSEENVKHLFNYAVEAVVDEYSIDTNAIYITGLSYGGRHTIIVSMDSDAGDIPTNIRGIIPFAPGMNSQNVADYENSTLFPICTCIGSLDNTFMPVATTFHDSVVANNGIAMLNEIEGIGHTTAFPEFVEEMLTCFNFIENAYITTSIDSYSLASGKVYPNPAREFVNIELVEEGVYTIELVDMSGKIILSNNYLGNQKVRIELDGIESGSYIIRQVVNNKNIKSILLSVY